MNPGQDLNYHAETLIRYTLIIWVIKVPTENDMVSPPFSILEEKF